MANTRHTKRAFHKDSAQTATFFHLRLKRCGKRFRATLQQNHVIGAIGNRPLGQGGIDHLGLPLQALRGSGGHCRILFDSHHIRAHFGQNCGGIAISRAKAQNLVARHNIQSIQKLGQTARL